MRHTCRSQCVWWTSCTARCVTLHHSASPAATPAVPWRKALAALCRASTSRSHQGQHHGRREDETKLPSCRSHFGTWHLSLHPLPCWGQPRVSHHRHFEHSHRLWLPTATHKQQCYHDVQPCGGVFHPKHPPPSQPLSRPSQRCSPTGDASLQGWHRQLPHARRCMKSKVRLLRCNVQLGQSAYPLHQFHPLHSPEKPWSSWIRNIGNIPTKPNEAPLQEAMTEAPTTNRTNRCWLHQLHQLPEGVQFVWLVQLVLVTLVDPSVPYVPWTLQSEGTHFPPRDVDQPHHWDLSEPSDSHLGRNSAKRPRLWKLASMQRRRPLSELKLPLSPWCFRWLRWLPSLLCFLQGLQPSK